MMMPHWAIECVDVDEAEELLDHSPPGSKIEVVQRENAEIVILWVPVASELADALLDNV